ncbi:hypothetical protein [Geoalkalibacter halelectricus]|uniref:Double Cache domain-containing protein n=1 Tax=Geoalkalibacter halelectricus TaxID=2847045 RepID=A0ABY5ZPQ6_9BACT|nr:hypothetical protein [Geoalkalibacter halelectricus]MDO3376908.1 hypothetical protein [Geoalkalibacter halelectricus]UWZ81132.1 hypothetical protein L9S41_06980 [Geoalkalibacter halelectricus]
MNGDKDSKHRTLASLPTQEEQHLGFQRFFVWSSALAFLIIISLSAFGTYLTFQNYIRRSAEDRSVRISRSLLEQDRATLIHQQPDGRARIALTTTDFDAFDERVRLMLEGFNVAKIKIYAADKTIIYSNDYAIIGLVDEDNRALEAALGGEVHSSIGHKGEFWDLQEELQLDIDVAETYIPIRDARGEVIGVYEIYLDVSHYRKDVRGLVLAVGGLLSAILGVVFLVIFTLLRKTSAIIHSKTQQIKVLSGLLPVCCVCKKIRNEQNEWEAMEEYISARSESNFSHSYCPSCLARHYPELKLDDD